MKSVGKKKNTPQFKLSVACFAFGCRITVESYSITIH